MLESILPYTQFLPSLNCFSALPHAQRHETILNDIVNIDGFTAIRSAQGDEKLLKGRTVNNLLHLYETRYCIGL